MVYMERVAVCDWVILDDIGVSTQVRNLLESFIKEHELCLEWVEGRLAGSLAEVANIDQEAAIACVGQGGTSLARHLEAIPGLRKEQFASLAQVEGSLRQYERYPIDRLVVLEDVVATGETLWKLRGGTSLGDLECDLVCSILNLSSFGPYKSGPMIPGYSRVYAQLGVICRQRRTVSGADGFWFPAIYSTRHLFGKDRVLGNWPKIASMYGLDPIAFCEWLNRAYVVHQPGPSR